MRTNLKAAAAALCLGAAALAGEPALAQHGGHSGGAHFASSGGHFAGGHGGHYGGYGFRGGYWGGGFYPGFALGLGLGWGWGYPGYYGWGYPGYWGYDYYDYPYGYGAPPPPPPQNTAPPAGAYGCDGWRWDAQAGKYVPAKVSCQ